MVRYPGEDHPGHEPRRDSVIMVGVMVLQIFTEIVEMVGMSEDRIQQRTAEQIVDNSVLQVEKELVEVFPGFQRAGFNRVSTVVNSGCAEKSLW